MRKSSKVIFVLGCLMIVTGLGLLLMLKFQTKQAEQMNDQIVQAHTAAILEVICQFLDHKNAVTLNFFAAQICKRIKGRTVVPDSDN